MTTPNIDTKALRELEAKATKGPWIASGFGGVQMDGYRDKYEVISEPHDSELFKVCWMRSWDGESRVTAHNNASLVAALRNAAPALLNLADRAQEQAKEIEALREVERAVRERGMPGALDFYREGRDEAERRVWAANETAREQIARCDAALAEAEKWRTAARVLCGAHVGLPQSACPVCERDALKAEVERLREALKAAATSLQTIGRDAGRDEYMDSLTETRVYAASRSRVAFSALRGEEAPRE